MDIKTPVTALNALPRVIGENFDNRSSRRIRKFFLSRTLARVPSILATLGIIFFVYRLAHELYSPAAAVSAALLAALSPNLIAHGTIATTDGYFALGVLSALYFFRRYLFQPTLANACLSGLTLALAQLMKPLALYLYLIVGVFLVVAIVRHCSMKTKGKELLIYAAVVAACCIGVLNIAYLFDRTLTPLNSYHFEGSSLRSLQNTWLIGKVRVPVPYPVLQGLDMAQHNDETGVTYGNIYLLGHSRSISEPDVILEPDQPVSGRILVSANRLVGILPKEKGPHRALRYRPIGHVGYAHLLFEIPLG